jgi:hypothetical protein
MRLPLAAALVAALSAPPARAVADEERQPVPYVLRPLSLPHLTLSPALDAAWLHGPSLGTLDPFVPNLGTLDLSAAFGITDDFQLAAVVVPLEITSDTARYGHASLGALYRFVGTAGSIFELAGSVTLGFPAQSDSLWIVDLAVPMRLHLGERVRIDLAPEFPFLIVGADTWDARFLLPISLAVQIVKPFFLGLTTGVTLASLHGGDVAATTFIPLGLNVGFTIPTARGPLGDILLTFTWPNFIYPDAGCTSAGPLITYCTHKVNPAIFTLALGARFYFYFGS